MLEDEDEPESNKQPVAKVSPNNKLNNVHFISNTLCFTFQFTHDFGWHAANQ